MKKIHLLGVVSLLALSLLLGGCGGTDKPAATENNQKTEQSQDMSNMDHSKMDMNEHQGDNK